MLSDSSTGQPDVTTPDTSEEMGPEEEMGPIPIEFGPSSVCNGRQAPSTDAENSLRVRVHSNGTDLIGASTARNGANLEAVAWNRLNERVDPVWLPTTTYNDLPGIAQKDRGTPTGITLQSFDGTPIWVVTRRDDEECVFVESIQGATTIGCGVDGATTYGPAITNLAQFDPRYFWFDDDGLISSMPFDDTSRGGGQIAVPWCINPGPGCLALDFGAVDARGNGGSHVLLSGPSGSAFAWDTTQQVPDPGADEDCGTPPEPPIPLTHGGNPMPFAAIDMLWVRDTYMVVRMTPEGLGLHEVDADFRLGEPVHTVQRPGSKVLLGTTTDGNRVAAVMRTSSDQYSVVAFGNAQDPEEASITANGSTEIKAGGVAIEGDDVGVILYTDAGVFANAFTMW